jgi:hypothetical protein
MNRISYLAIALAVVTSAACKKDRSETGDTAAGNTSAGNKPTEPAAPAPAPTPKASGPFSGWDMAARTAAFQGAHVTPGNSLGMWEAWNVQGDKVTIWNGTDEKTYELTLISPCEVKVTEKTSDGGSSSTVKHYTLKDGAIVMGLGDAGARKGDEAIACVSNLVFTLDAKGTCTEWKASLFDEGKYEQKPGTCGFRKDGDKEVFAVTARGYEHKLEVHGDALLSQQLASTHSEKVADFAAAKAARDSKR